ncbi:hypothetical protein WM40_15490 [Robbsia andropogonis]|uniref:Rieske domain-containing protein n=1 Tax=Robbsia andropogonis TaxID=28092 RepID=A0A0F5JY56_9BURK|nr:hypothetical protein WM40_15490 [Robbsia andropogonis]
MRADRPLARRLLGESVVLFRDASGDATALANRCPHRFAPLSGGNVGADGTLGCPYHGLRFDSTGRCVHNPHGDGRIPDAARVRRFPVKERDSAVWIWMGEPSLCNAAWETTARFPFLSRDENEISTGYLRSEAHYQLSADNLLDLSHFQFLHPDTLGSPAMAADPGRFEQRGDTVWSLRGTCNEILPPFVAQAFGVPPGMPVDRRLAVRWDPPGLMEITITVSPTGQDLGRISHSAHLLTPETEESTHYFFAFGVPKAVGPEAKQLVRFAVDGLMTPFAREDLPMLAAQQASLGNRDFWDALPVLLPIDGGAIRARRVMARRREQEQP